MAGVGFSELVVLFLVALIVLGPKRLPQVANQLGTWIGQARRMTRVLRRQLEDELNLDENFSIRTPPGESTSRPASGDNKASSSIAAAATNEAADLETAAPPRDDDHYSPLHEAEVDALDSADVDKTPEVLVEHAGEELKRS